MNQEGYIFDDDDANDARIIVVGIGPFGCRMAQKLVSDLPGIAGYEVSCNAKCAGSEELTKLISLVRESDLLFIISEFNDGFCGEIARAVGHSAHEAGVLTLAIIPDSGGIPPQRLAELFLVVDTVFSVSYSSFTDDQAPQFVEKDSLTEYSIRHLVSTITTLIIEQSFVCLDFADITTVLRKGTFGKMGVGVGSGPARGGGGAATQALDRLTVQGVPTFNSNGVATLATTGVLACVHGASMCIMDDYIDANRAIHNRISEDTKTFLGLITDDQLGQNIRVTVMTVW